MDPTGVVSAAWSSALTSLVPREALLPGVVDPRSPPVEPEAALAVLRASGLESLLAPCFLELLQKHLQERVVRGCGAVWARRRRRRGGAALPGGELFLPALLHLQAALEPFLHGQQLLQQWGLVPEPHGEGVRGSHHTETHRLVTQRPTDSPHRDPQTRHTETHRLVTQRPSSLVDAFPRLDYPESQHALQELQVCLKKTNQKGQLVASLKTALETRLLHPGVNTDDIITLYISAIRALTQLDPTGVTLDVVCQPVRKYLRSREDTVRKIVAGLTDDVDGPSELAGELTRAEPVELEHSLGSDDDGDEPEDWSPPPCDAAHSVKSGLGRRSFDIISLLVSIYGSKEVFINEYHTLLADRILHHFNYNMAREIRNLELLKLRFGDVFMHRCEVMLKDVADSRRINSNILEARRAWPGGPAAPVPLNAMILSGEFWPPLKEGKLELPAAVKEVMEAYTREYEKLKAARSLVWKPHLGLVSLDVHLAGGRSLSLSVSPVHAAIIMHFQDKASWTLQELSEALKVPAPSLRKKLALWQQRRVLREGPPDRFSLLEDGRHDDGGLLLLLDSDDDNDSAMASQADQKEEEMQVFWTYIQGMLTNLETLSLERIHSMLKMFAMIGPAGGECDLAELRAFLGRKVKEQQLLCSGGMYKLPKPGA
ncbi:LOW QUALITY PROTEIN: anaphase-promoting complex subunit 2 [Lampetra fluviatilis]